METQIKKAEGSPMKRILKILFICVFTILLVLCALFLLRYGSVKRRVLPNGYVVETHRDNFYMFGFPGSGSDMQGFCKVVPPVKGLTPAYFYLEMMQFESEINEETISVQNGRVEVISPMVKPISENIWRLLLF